MFKNINYSKGGVRQIYKNLCHNGNCEYDETLRKKTKLKNAFIPWKYII